MSSKPLGTGAFVTLMLVALMFGANHVAARFALDHGVDPTTAVAVRSLCTALIVGAIVLALRVPLVATARHRRVLPAIGLLVALQSYLLYSAVARMPVALALLAFNTFPLWTAAWAFVIYRERPERAVLMAMPVILFGLALALDLPAALADRGTDTMRLPIGPGVAYACGAAALFGAALVLTQHEASALDGRWRTALTMAIVGVLALGMGLARPSGLHWPHASVGWWGLAALTVLYGTAFTIMFMILPRLGVVGHSPLMNVEPVFALLLAWALLGQRLSPLQVVGALVVVAGVMSLGLRRRS